MRRSDEWHDARELLLRHRLGAVWLARNYLHVRDRAGILRPLEANASQREFEWRRGPENIVLKARQMGMSTWVAGRFLLKTLLVPGTVTLMVAHTQESAEALFRTVQRMWENLPHPLQLSAQRVRANARQMVFAGVDSEFRVASAGEANAGRGLSVQNLHCSEVARWPGDAAATLAGLRAALVPGGELVLESTAHGAHGCFYEAWQQAERNGMVRHFFPWWWEPEYAGAPALGLTEEEALLVRRAGLSAEQVGFRRELQRRFGAMREQEFAEDAVSCFRESGACFFDREAIARIEVTHVADRPLQIFLPPVGGRQYIAAVDVAGGGSEGDFSAVQVIDVATGMQCAELQVRVSPRELALRVAELAREYNGAMVVVERNNHGAAVLAYLENECGVDVFCDRDGMPGWLTDSASRPKMLSGLARLLASSPRLFASARLLAEMRSFVVDAHGRAAAAVGSHDDLVMSLAIAQAVRGRMG